MLFIALDGQQWEGDANSLMAGLLVLFASI